VKNVIIKKSIHLTHRLVTDYGGTDEVGRVISKGGIEFSETETEHRARTLAGKRSRVSMAIEMWQTIG